MIAESPLLYVCIAMCMHAYYICITSCLCMHACMCACVRASLQEKLNFVPAFASGNLQGMLSVKFPEFLVHYMYMKPHTSHHLYCTAEKLKYPLHYG